MLLSQLICKRNPSESCQRQLFETVWKRHRFFSTRLSTPNKLAHQGQQKISLLVIVV